MCSLLMMIDDDDIHRDDRPTDGRTESATRGEAGVAGRRRAIERTIERVIERVARERGDSIDRSIRVDAVSSISVD